MAVEEVTAGPVVVGADGSEPSLRAVRWAAQEAATRGTGLTVCCVAVAGTDEQPMLWDGQQLVLLPADEVLRRAIRVATDTTADVAVAGDVLRGDPAYQLLARAREAELLVVGARGLGAFVGLLVGSVSEHVAGRADCPVVVVRGEASPDLPVLVGVDGSAANQAAVGFAFAAAARRGVELVALSAAEPEWIRPAVGSPALAVDIEGVEHAARGRLDDAVRQWTDRYPDLAVRRVAVPGAAARALIEASSRAALAVVGSRGHGTLSGVFLGSVSRHLMRHADCPVAIVRG